jgi:uncharacterized protein (DUF362 family)
MSDAISVIYGATPHSMVTKLLEHLAPERGWDRNALIGIKPNLVVPKPHTSGATTSPEIVAGVIEYFQEKGYRNIIILEGSWVGARTSEAFRVCGYQELAKKYQVPLLDLQQDDSKEVSAGNFRLKVCRRALEVDYLINIPVLKGHCQTGMTCALKNLKGCIPDAEKRRFHTMGLHQPIAFLNRILKQDLIIVDGITGDLDFEEGGNPVRMDRILAGTDPVLIDSYAAQLLGFDPTEIAYINLAHQLGVGQLYQSDVKLTELNRDSVATPRSRTGRVQKLAGYIADRDACSACYGSLIHALARLKEADGLSNLKAKICIGQGYRGETHPGIGVGSCTRGCAAHLDGCPPTAKAMLEFLKTSRSTSSASH